MAYKINIRNAANTAWVNLLEAQYIQVLDANSKFTGTTVESVLEELFDNKAQRVTSTANPTTSDDEYQVGSVWVNTTAGTVFVCTDNTTNAAVWLDVSSFEVEDVQDIVGAMVSSNNESNITVTYDDVNGKLDFSVATATTTTLGVASFNSAYFTVTSGAVSIAPDAITVNELAHNIDATGIGFNADKVDGTDVNDLGSTTSDLWTAAKITEYVDSVASGLSWQEPVLMMDINDPPASPTTGDRYVVSIAPPSATGAWIGHDNEIAEWDGSQWVFTPVQEGFALWNENDDVQYVYNGSSWAKIGTTVTHANLLGLQGGNGGSELYHLTNAEHGSITGSKTANYVFASPDGTSGTGGFRALVANDIPTLLSSKISDFTEAAQDAFGAAIAAGTQTNITVTYDDSGNTISYSVPLATTTSGSPGVASFDSSFFTVSGAGHVSLTASAVDHGALSGLADDDHTQYVHNTIARTITAQHSFSPSASQAPFTLGVNAQGQLVTGFNADLLNGQDWTVAATGSAPSTPQANDVWIEITA